MASNSQQTGSQCSDPLLRATVKTPCHMDWERMEGDDRRRFCSRCERPVYQLSHLSREEATELISGDSPVCVRMFRRPDGTVVTSECPPLAAKTRFQFSIATLVVLLTASAAAFASLPWIGRKIEPIVQDWLRPAPPVAPGPPVFLMGDVEIEWEDTSDIDDGVWDENVFVDESQSDA